MQSRLIRIFISSTFRDFGRERDLLAREVFPELRKRARERRVEIAGIDLRWGITEEESARGETLPICLAEIDRSRPYFIGLMGERYGWIPKAEHYPAKILENWSWLQDHIGGASVTELEILHGVLNNPAMATRALFYFRNPEYSLSRGVDFVSSNAEESAKTLNLKKQIRYSGFPLLDGYASPEAVAVAILEDLWQRIDIEFPLDGIPDARLRQQWDHDAYSESRRALFLGRKTEWENLENWYSSASDEPDTAGSRTRGLILLAKPGEGASSLLANWVVQAANEDAPMREVFLHHSGCSGQSAELSNLLGRWRAWIDTRLGESPSAEDGDPEESMNGLAEDLGKLSGLIKRNQQEGSGRPMLMILDELEQINSPSHLPWLPDYIPPGLRIVVCSREESHLAACESRGWGSLLLGSLDSTHASMLAVARLTHHRKRLPEDDLNQVISHSMTGNPKFLTTLLDELAVAATHETLRSSMELLLSSQYMGDLLAKILHRVETDLPDFSIAPILTALLTSRDGLAEHELLEMTGLTPLNWGKARLALDQIILESGGKIRLAHTDGREAIHGRYLKEEQALQAAHSKAADWWLTKNPDDRTAYELPWQLAQAKRWMDLQMVLLDPAHLYSLLGATSEAELLGYWRQIADAKEIDDFNSMLMEQLEAQWLVWQENGLPANGIDEGILALRLGGFLEYAGCSSPFSLRILQKSVELGRKGNQVSLALRLNNAGNEKLRLNCPTEALQDFQECLEIRRQILPAGHPHTLGTIDNIGQALIKENRLEEGINSLREALALRVEHMGPNHPDTATSQNNLAMGLMKLTQEEASIEAGDLLDLAYRSSIVTLGRNDPDTGISAGNLGMWLAQRGDMPAALELMQEAVRIHVRTLGEDHPYVNVGRMRLADIRLKDAVKLRDQGQLDRALEIMVHEVVERESSDPAGYHLAQALSAIGETYARLGRHDNARDSLEKALAIRTHHFGPNHPSTRLVQDRLNLLPPKD